MTKQNRHHKILVRVQKQDKKFNREFQRIHDVNYVEDIGELQFFLLDSLNYMKRHKICIWNRKFYDWKHRENDTWLKKFFE